jgi:hypothetical protein
MVPLLGAVFESTTGLKLRDLIAGQQPRDGRLDGATTETQRTDGATDAAATPEIAVLVPTVGNGAVDIAE